MYIFSVLMALTLGIIAGKTKILPSYITHSMDRILMVIIYALLFFVGMEIGSYKEVISNMGILGTKSFILAFGSIAGSGFFCLMILKRG